MNHTVFNRIVAGLVCALLGDIPVAILNMFVYHLDQAGMIGWILISAGLFALYLRFFERSKSVVTPADPNLNQ